MTINRIKMASLACCGIVLLLDASVFAANCRKEIKLLAKRAVQLVEENSGDWKTVYQFYSRVNPSLSRGTDLSALEEIKKNREISVLAHDLSEKLTPLIKEVKRNIGAHKNFQSSDEVILSGLLHHAEIFEKVSRWDTDAARYILLGMARSSDSVFNPTLFGPPTADRNINKNESKILSDIFVTWSSIARSINTFANAHWDMNIGARLWVRAWELKKELKSVKTDVEFKSYYESLSSGKELTQASAYLFTRNQYLSRMDELTDSVRLLVDRIVREHAENKDQVVREALDHEYELAKQTIYLYLYAHSGPTFPRERDLEDRESVLSKLDLTQVLLSEVREHAAGFARKVSLPEIFKELERRYSVFVRIFYTLEQRERGFAPTQNLLTQLLIVSEMEGLLEVFANRLRIAERLGIYDGWGRPVEDGNFNPDWSEISKKEDRILVIGRALAKASRALAVEMEIH